MEYNTDETVETEGKEQKRMRRADGFVIAVIILLVILAVLIAVAVFVAPKEVEKPSNSFPFFFGESPAPRRTPAQERPEADGAEASPSPFPAPALRTPAPEDRQMPEMDGTVPDLSAYADSFYMNNPIPEICATVADSVVGVLNYRTQTFGRNRMMEVYGSGSGFIISSKGYVLTNAHVVEEAEKIGVLFSDGTEVEALLIGSDNDSDVAVLKVEKEDLVPIAVGDSESVRVGEFVIAIGNPLDSERLANTVTLGVISATARELTIDGNTNEYLQTDAAINFGNSGGPLINMHGEVVGMNSAKTMLAGYDEYGNAYSAEGLGFALPINYVEEIMAQLITEGSIERPAVGIMVYTMTESYAAQQGIDYMPGVGVSSVVAGGPADLAGIRAGDVITELNGQPVSEKEVLIAYIGTRKIGDTVELTVVRKGETLHCTIELSNKAGLKYSN